MYCIKCGTLNPDNAIHCVNCGYPFPAVTPTAGSGYTVRPPQVPTRLPQAILVTMFCCQPFGIVAIVYAALATSKLSSGDYAGAMDCSQKATTWCWLAFWLGFVPMLFYIFFLIIAAASS